VLSLPVLAAAISSFVITGVNGWFMRWLLPPPIGAYGVHLPLSQMLIQSAEEYWSAYWPLLLGGFFLQSAIYVTALFVTVGASRRLTSEDAPASLLHGMMFARMRWRDVIGLSLAGSGLFAIYAALRFGVIYLSATYLVNRMLSHESVGLEILRWRIEVSALYTVLACIEAWILAGMGMRSIGTYHSQEIARAQARRGKLLAVVTVLLSVVLRFVLSSVKRMLIPEGGLDGTVAGWELNAVQALIAAFPYVLLFIALALIVDGDAMFGEGSLS
jgi:hypothetical protein